MAKTSRIDKSKLLDQLDPVQYEPEQTTDTTYLEKVNMAGALLALAEIDHEHEHGLCCRIAQHLLQEVPQPDDIELEEG